MEKSFSVHIDGFIISGRIDRVDRAEKSLDDKQACHTELVEVCSVDMDSRLRGNDNKAETSVIPAPAKPAQAPAGIHHGGEFYEILKQVQNDKGGIQDDRKSCKIIDYKTGRLRSQELVDNDLQLSLYALAAEKCLGLKVESLSLYFLEHDLEIITKRSDEDLKKTEQKILCFAQGMKRGDFEASPSEGKCACCDYRGMCVDSLKI